MKRIAVVYTSSSGRRTVVWLDLTVYLQLKAAGLIREG